MLGRLIYAVLVAIVVYIVLVIIGGLLHIGLILAWAAIIAVLVGLLHFFYGGNRPAGPRGPVV